MERFTLAPNTREIIVNRASDAADDLFSYGPETSAQARALGHLFIVGHTEHETDTAGYLVSLIAAMAKREYYASQPTDDAKQSFARMLRKVNEVVGEFFKANEIKINVGIFAVAGNTMYVSRLGKFRILLARKSKVVDVLKDVSLFSKEVVQKDRFSSIISGPILAQDRLLAYFPQLALTRREKVIRAHMHDDSPQELSERLAEIGKKTPSFSCSLLHIDIAQIPVADASESPTPEGADTRLAWKPRQHAGVDIQPGPVDDEANVGTDIGGGSESIDETPNIIPSEFTHRTRTNSVARAFRNVRLIRSGARGKALILGLAVLAVIGGTYVFKSALFTSESEQQLQAVLDAASRELTSIHTLIEENNGDGARAQVLAQLSALGALTDESDSPDIGELYGSFLDTLNEIDRAEPASVTLEASIPADEGVARMATVASGSDTIWVIANAPVDAGYVLLQIIDGIITESEVLELDANLLVPAPPVVLLGDTSERTLFLYGSLSGIHTLPTPDRILDADWFADFAYLLTSSGIMKVADLETVKPVTKQWLSDVSELASSARLIAVDGDIWTLSADGTLTKYYRGEKVADAQLALTITDAHRLLTTPEMPFMYVADTDLKRVHVIDKESMSLIHTVTFDTQQSVRDIFLGPDFSLLFLAGDGKIWRVE